MTLGVECREVIAKDCAIRSVLCPYAGGSRIASERLSDRLVRDFSLGRAVDVARLMEEPRAGGSHAPYPSCPPSPFSFFRLAHRRRPRIAAQ